MNDWLITLLFLQRLCLLTLLCSQFLCKIVIIWLISAFYFEKSLLSSTIVLSSLNQLILQQIFMLFLFLPSNKHFLGLHLVFYCFAYQSVCGRPLYILRIQTSKVVNVARWTFLILFNFAIYKLFLGNSRVVAQPLEMFFISRIKVLLTLRHLRSSCGHLSVLKSAVRKIGLICIGVSSVIGRMVQLHQ